MARRTSDMLSAAMGSGADGGVDEDGAGRDTWLCRSTICANEEELDEDDHAAGCSWSQLHTPTPLSVELARRDSGGETNAGCAFEATSTGKTEQVSSNSRKSKAKRRLPLLLGFSNAEALRAQLPRITSNRSQITRGDEAPKDKVPGKTTGLAMGTTSYAISPSEDEIEANRRKWDLERKLQDADQSCISVDSIGASLPRRDLKRKLQNLNPAIPSAAEVEANRRKWSLERRLQDADRNGASTECKSSGPDRKRDLRRKLQTLNPFAMKMIPAGPSTAEVEANRRKWELERRLQDADRIVVANDSADDSPPKRDLRRKLQDLNPFAVTPSILSAAEVEANRRKWELERRLQEFCGFDASNDECKRNCELGRKLPSLNPVPSSVAGDGAVRTKVDLKGNLPMEGQLQMENEHCKNVITASASPRPSGIHPFEMSESLVYLLLFFSTVVLHCTIFNFNLEVRQFLRLDIFPFGVLLLLSWIFVGLIHFVGGVVGDLARDRIQLLTRTAALWSVAIVACQVAAFQVSSVVSSMSLVSGLLCAGVAHGILCPNVIALRIELSLCSLQPVRTLLSPEDDEDSSSEEDSSAESESSYLSSASTVMPDKQQQQNGLARHNFFSACFATRLAGSSLVQGYYFLLVGVDTFPDEESQTMAVSRGYHCTLLMSVGLMASLIFFCFQSWGCRQNGHCSSESMRANSEDQKLEHKLAILERGFSESAKAIWTWSWKNLMRLCNRALVGYALLAFMLMTLIGIGFSLIVVLLAYQTSLSLRLVAFLLIVTGWLLTMVASSRQLNPTKKQLLRECRRLGLRSRHLYMAIFAVAFVCISGCVSFLRAQLYTTMVVQVCQTRLLIPGTTHTLFDPELLGTAVGTSSLFFVGLSRVLTRSLSTVEIANSGPSSSTKGDIFTTTIPTTPVLRGLPKRSRTLLLLPSMASCPPVTRMCFAMLLYLVSIFMSSVVELYRRKAEVSPSVLPRSCGSVHSEFTFLWTSPYVVLLGASDALFRVSLQEACHDLAQGTFTSASTKLALPCRRWASTVQGFIALAEALGYTTGLSLVAVLSRWLFEPEPTDMALLFLLLTTVVALTHALLNRVAARAQAYQRLYFPVHRYSASS
ncbi:unnamed protein product [Phytophthora lilii]|uniref:Unnamed protein product n=1 Tax=Phytophthora lilii TaxID=2077276 RepID=A0A9W6TN64_9STRA|nr:unnamed protein product [Phytophthora lilii]